jgi:hypothetical protein
MGLMQPRKEAVWVWMLAVAVAVADPRTRRQFGAGLVVQQMKTAARI